MKATWRFVVLQNEKFRNESWHKEISFLLAPLWHWLFKTRHGEGAWRKLLLLKMLVMEKLLIYGFFVELFAFASIKWTLNGDWNDKHFPLRWEIFSSQFFIWLRANLQDFPQKAPNIYYCGVFLWEGSFSLFPSRIRVCEVNKNWHEMNGCWDSEKTKWWNFCEPFITFGILRYST